MSFSNEQQRLCASGTLKQRALAKAHRNCAATRLLHLLLLYCCYSCRCCERKLHHNQPNCCFSADRPDRPVCSPACLLIRVQNSTRTSTAISRRTVYSAFAFQFPLTQHMLSCERSGSETGASVAREEKRTRTDGTASISERNSGRTMSPSPSQYQSQSQSQSKTHNDLSCRSRNSRKSRRFRFRRASRPCAAVRRQRYSAADDSWSNEKSNENDALSVCSELIRYTSACSMLFTERIYALFAYT